MKIVNLFDYIWFKTNRYEKDSVNSERNNISFFL